MSFYTFYIVIVFIAFVYYGYRNFNDGDREKVESRKNSYLSPVGCGDLIVSLILHKKCINI